MVMLAADGPIMQIPRTQLRPGPWQPRKIFDPNALTDLASSLKTRGVLTPLRVVPSSDGGGYLIVAGERRWRAAALAEIAELPCLLMDERTGQEALHEMALLDNLHRANLRPGEEARAVAALESLGTTQAEIARSLGKSQTWVNQRVAVAKLPDRALEQLDQGAITGEEARALAKLLDHPELVDACLEPSGSRLREHLGAHVPESLGERVQAVRRFLEMERRRDLWASKMRTEGHQVLSTLPHESDRRFVRLMQGSELSRAHQAAKLSCEVWAWEHGQPVRYCDNPAALRRIVSNSEGSAVIDHTAQEAYRKAVEREAARDEAISAWLATTRGVEPHELVTLARERIRSLTESDDRLLVRLGTWLGATGERMSRIALAEREVAEASERRLLQLWFTLEIAQAVSYALAPSWLVPWLAMIGFNDPHHAVAAATANDVQTLQCQWAKRPEE
jgi:ParB family chromosome partitioning protein